MDPTPRSSSDHFPANGSRDGSGERGPCHPLGTPGLSSHLSAPASSWPSPDLGGGGMKGDSWVFLARPACGVPGDGLQPGGGLGSPSRRHAATLPVDSLQLPPPGAHLCGRLSLHTVPGRVDGDACCCLTARPLLPVPPRAFQPPRSRRRAGTSVHLSVRLLCAGGHGKPGCTGGSAESQEPRLHASCVT